MRARLGNRLVDLDDDELAIQFLQSDFAGYRWPLEHALRAWLASCQVTCLVRADLDRFYDVVAIAARLQDGDQQFYESGFGRVQRAQ